jgi:hypothetical protein
LRPVIKLPRPSGFRPRLAAWLRPISVALAFASALPARAAGPSPAASVRYGLIWLEVQPEKAEVSLDGEFLGQGVWLISAAPGEHEIRVRKAGFRDYAGRIAVPAGGSVHVDVRLTPGAAGDS